MTLTNKNNHNKRGAISSSTAGPGKLTKCRGRIRLLSRSRESTENRIDNISDTIAYLFPHVNIEDDSLGNVGSSVDDVSISNQSGYPMPKNY